jgi:GNAT superfamily N-acetyltransferase
MTIANIAALRRVSDYFLATLGGGQSVRSGPFTILLDPIDDNPYRNYAFPDEGAAPDTRALSDLCALFAARARKPRLEYLPDLAPAVLPALTVAGFTAEGRLPLLSCTVASLRPPPDDPDVLCCVVQDAADFEAATRAQAEAYGQVAITEHDVARLRRTARHGGGVVLARARSDTEALGAGLYQPPIDGVTEIAALGVRKQARGRGVGALITALLAAEALNRGADLPFLMAGTEAEERIFLRLGFSRFGTMLHISQ